MSIATDDGVAQVLDHVDLRIPRGRIVGVVGESGCGKSTLVRAVLGILPRAAGVEGGRILFDGEDLLALSQPELTRRIRGSPFGASSREIMRMVICDWSLKNASPSTRW